MLKPHKAQMSEENDSPYQSSQTQIFHVLCFELDFLFIIYIYKDMKLGEACKSEEEKRGFGNNG